MMTLSALYQTKILSYIFHSSSALRHQSARKNVAPLGQIILINQEQTSLCYYSLMLCVLRRSIKYQLYSCFDTRYWLKPTLSVTPLIWFSSYKLNYNVIKNYNKWTMCSVINIPGNNLLLQRGRRGRMVVGFTTTCVISAYHN